MADIAKPAEKPKWATGGSAAVTTPPSGKQDLGWVVEYPPHQFFNWLAKWTYRWIEYFEAKGDSSLGGAAETTLTLVSGVATPTLGKHRIDTEGATAADDLTHLAQSGLDDGRLLFLRSVSAGRVVTVKHLAGGTGEINLRLGADLVLDNPNKWLLLTRNGTQWIEVMASFVGADPAPHLGANLDVRARKITTSTTNGDVVVEPNGTGALSPGTTGKALGKAAARWAAFLASANVAGNILPDSDSARDLGATGTRWDEIFGDFGSFTNWVRTASIDSEGAGGTLNIGDVQAALINIGRVGATIALHGSVTEVHTTNTFVQDKLVTFNDEGLAGTGSNSGFEIEEGGAVAGWVKTSDGSSQSSGSGGPDSRIAWRVKAPGRSGERILRAVASGMSDGLQTRDAAYFDTIFLPTGETHTHFNLSVTSGILYFIPGKLITKNLDVDALGQIDVVADGQIDEISPKENLPTVSWGFAGSGVDAFGVVMSGKKFYEEGNWQPILDGGTIGNGSLSGRYVRIGNQVTVSIRLICGGTTNFTTNPGFSGLPFPSIVPMVGGGRIYDVGSGWAYADVELITGTATGRILAGGINGGTVYAPITNTYPMTWAAGDEMYFTLTYFTN